MKGESEMVPFFYANSSPVLYQIQGACRESLSAHSYYVPIDFNPETQLLDGSSGIKNNCYFIWNSRIIFLSLYHKPIHERK